MRASYGEAPRRGQRTRDAPVSCCCVTSVVPTRISRKENFPIFSSLFAMRRAAALARSRIERARPPLYAFTLTRRGVVNDEGEEGERKAPSHQAAKKGPAAIPSQPVQSVRVAFKATDPSHTALWMDVRCKHLVVSSRRSSSILTLTPHPATGQDAHAVDRGSGADSRILGNGQS